MMRPLTTTLAGLYLLIINSLGFPVLSEFMASNDTKLPDEDGDFSDWIEIANMGITALDLAGHHLTDDEEELTRIDHGVGGEIEVDSLGEADVGEVERRDPDVRQLDELKIVGAGGIVHDLADDQ